MLVREVEPRRSDNTRVAITASVGARGRYFNTVDLVNRLEEESRLGKAGAFAAQLFHLVLDELGYLPLARSGGQPPWLSGRASPARPLRSKINLQRAETSSR